MATSRLKARARDLLSTTLVPRTRTGRLLAAVAVVDAAGTGMYLTGSALYFTRIVGFEATEVGLALTVGGAVGLASATPVGLLADRLGAGRMLIGLQLLRAAAFLVYCTVTTFIPFLVTTAVLGVVEAVVSPINVAVIGAAVGEDDRIDTMAKSRAARNVGFGLGAVVAGVAIGIGSRPAFLALIAADAVSCVLTAMGLHRVGVTRLAPRLERPSGARRFAVPNLRYLSAALCNGVLSIHTTLLFLGLPLWLSEQTSVPAVMVSVCVTINTLMAVLLQASFARPAVSLTGAARCMYAAGAALAIMCVTAATMAWVRAPLVASALAILATLALTAGELWQSAGEWKISYSLADPLRRSQYLTTFSLGTAGQRVVAPALVTGGIIAGPAGWLVLGVVLLITGRVFPAIARAGDEHEA